MFLIKFPNVLHNRSLSVFSPAPRTPPAGRSGGLRAEDLPMQLVATVVPHAAVGDKNRGGVASAMRAPPESSSVQVVWFNKN